MNLAYNILFPGQAVDSAYLHVSSPFKAPSGGGLGKPPPIMLKRAGLVDALMEEDAVALTEEQKGLPYPLLRTVIDVLDQKDMKS